jgi:hypothetical protein
VFPLALPPAKPFIAGKAVLRFRKRRTATGNFLRPLFLFGIFFAQNLKALPLDSWRSTLARRIIVKILAKRDAKILLGKVLRRCNEALLGQMIER